MSQSVWELYWSPFDPKRDVKANMGKIRKSSLFDKNGKWLAHFFCQKLNIFNLLYFLIWNVPKCLRIVWLPVWSMKRALRQIWGKFEKSSLFDKNGKGLAHYFCQKFEYFHSSLFPHLECPKVSRNCMDLHLIQKRALRQIWWKFENRHFLRKMASFLPKNEYFQSSPYFSHRDMSQQCPQNRYATPVWSRKREVKCQILGEMRKIHHFFDKKGKGLAHHFCQKM